MLAADDAANELEGRLGHLEAIAAPQSIRPSSSSSSLLESLDDILSKFKEILADNPTIDAFIRKYTALQDSLRYDSNDLERALLDARAIKEIILASTDDIDVIGEQLGQLETLKHEVDCPLLKDLRKHIPQLSPLEARFIEQRKVVTRQKEQFLQQLDSYNAFIDSTSRLFIHYHQVLSMMEDMLTQAEKAATKKKEEG